MSKPYWSFLSAILFRRDDIPTTLGSILHLMFYINLTLACALRKSSCITWMLSVGPRFYPVRMISVAPFSLPLFLMTQHNTTQLGSARLFREVFSTCEELNSKLKLGICSLRYLHLNWFHQVQTLALSAAAAADCRLVIGGLNCQLEAVESGKTPRSFCTTWRSRALIVMTTQQRRDRDQLEREKEHC